MSNPVVNMVQEIRSRVRKDLYEGTLNYESSMAMLRRQISIAGRMNNVLLKAQIYETMGTVELELGNYEDGYAYYQEALQACQLIDDEYRVGIMFNNLGEVHRRWGKLQEAAEFYVRARHIAEAANEVSLVITAYNNEGQTWLRAGQLDRAIDLLELGLHIASENQDWDPDTVKQSLPELRCNLSEAYAQQSRFEDAWEQVQRAFVVAMEFKQQHLIARAYKSMATIAMLDSASDHDIPHYFEKSFEHYLKVGSKVEIGHLLKMEGHYWLSLGEHQKASRVYERAILYFDQAYLPEEAQQLREKLALT